MFQKIKSWLTRMAEGKWAVPCLAILSFTESSVFPIPPDTMLMPMTLVKKDKWLFYATVTTAASVVGGIAGYFIGLFFFDVFAKGIIEFYHAGHHFETVQNMYNEYGFAAVFAAGLTPIPYKVFTIAAGLFKMNLLAFTVASVFGRGIRFYLEAYIVHRFGDRAMDILEKNFLLITGAIAVLVIAGVTVWNLLR